MRLSAFGALLVGAHEPVKNRRFEQCEVRANEHKPRALRRSWQINEAPRAERINLPRLTKCARAPLSSCAPPYAPCYETVYFTALLHRFSVYTMPVPLPQKIATAYGGGLAFQGTKRLFSLGRGRSGKRL